MNGVIEFKRTKQFLGRNGVARMAGIVVERHGDHLYLAPITSKGKVGRAYLLVPREHAREVANLMARLAGRSSNT